MRVGRKGLDRRIIAKSCKCITPESGWQSGIREKPTVLYSTPVIQAQVGSSLAAVIECMLVANESNRRSPFVEEKILLGAVETSARFGLAFVVALCVHVIPTQYKDRSFPTPSFAKLSSYLYRKAVESDILITQNTSKSISSNIHQHGVRLVTGLDL